MSDSKTEKIEMSRFDKAVSVFFPERAKKNLEARQELHEFQNRDLDRKPMMRGGSGGLHSNASPETHKKNRDRINTMWDARNMEDKSPLISGILERTCQYAIGKLEYKSNTGNAALDQIYEDYFHQWCKHADITGRQTFRELVQCALRGLLRDGDYGFCILNDGNNIKLQSVEADRIGNPQDPQIRKPGYFGGIHVNENGAPESYKIFKLNETNQYSFDKDVPADHFIHLYKFTRASQYRGTSWLKTVLDHSRDLFELFEYEKQGAKFASMWAAFIKKKEIKDNTTGLEWDPNAPGSISRNKGIFKAEPGKVARIGLDEDIQFAPGIQRPSGAFTNLLEAIIHHIALGLNLPYGFVYKMSSFGGVTARLETSFAQRTFELWQRLLIDRVLDRVRDQVISLGVATGKIPPHPRQLRGSWRFGAHITSDIQHQTNADIQLIKEGLMTRSEWSAVHDKDFADTQRTLAQEVNIMRDAASEGNIPIELLHEGKPQATELLAAMNERHNPPPPEPDSLLQKGFDLKPLLEILKEVGDGSMDRDSAVYAIVTAYGEDNISHQEADLIVPTKQPAPAIDINSPITSFPITSG